MIKKITASFCILIALSMIGLWGMLLVTGNVPELETEPFAIAFHFVAEFVTALALLVSGYGFFKNKKWSSVFFLLSIGALLYTAINSAGYYVQLGSFEMVLMFAVIFITAIILTYLCYKNMKCD